MGTLRLAANALATRNDEAAMKQIIAAARDDYADDDDIARLAEVLAYSGCRLPSVDRQADVASTGGPGSLSTLLSPLALRHLGLRVPKLGVPGRPAGGIDVLGSLPGYRVRLTSAEAQEGLRRSGYVHMLVDDKWAPLDASLFRYRQQVGAQRLVPLVIASLLSKKLAVGLTRVALDARVAPHGNFGASLDEARRAGTQFVRVAALLGITAVCILSDSRRPMQPYIGRGEALVALARIFDGAPGDYLSKHAQDCLTLARSVVEDEGSVLRLTELRQHFTANLAEQGSSDEVFRLRVAQVQAAPRRVIRARRVGWFEVDLEMLRACLVSRQRIGASEGTAFADPVGVTLMTIPGERAQPGQQLAAVRGDPADTDLFTAVTSSMRLLDAPADPSPTWASETLR
jgi:thymidine phosphorylase